MAKNGEVSTGNVALLVERIADAIRSSEPSSYTTAAQAVVVALGLEEHKRSYWSVVNDEDGSSRITLDASEHNARGRVAEWLTDGYHLERTERTWWSTPGIRRVVEWSSHA